MQTAVVQVEGAIDSNRLVRGPIKTAADARNGATFYFTLPKDSKKERSDNNMIVY